ncbi:MAG: hypothetical protein ABL891_18470 [Burkholderiales bacterium]
MKSMKKKRLVNLSLAMWVTAAMTLAGTARAAEEPTYSADLAILFNEHQRVLVLRDACVTLQPEKKADVSGAYEDWLNRHVRIVDDLDNRFAAIIKRASKNQAEYTKNYGKYQSEVLQLRDENKKALLADKEKLAQQCAELPGYLRHPKSDIPAVFPAEFKRIYRVR